MLTGPLRRIALLRQGIEVYNVKPCTQRRHVVEEIRTHRDVYQQGGPISGNKPLLSIKENDTYSRDLAILEGPN